MSNSTSTSDGVSQKSSLAYTLSLNMIFFAILILFFEFNRYLPRLFLKRLRGSFKIEDRVPGRPPRHLFGWIRHIMSVSNGEFLRMIGLDGYMLLRFISICFKFCFFGTVFGLTILVPIYAQGNQGLGGWQQYTLSNVVSTGEVTTDALWLPAVFSYMYLCYAMYLFHAEFEHFVLKRLEFLIQGDPDTFQQTHYTIMIENVPPPLRTATTLTSFFDKLFPGEVYSATIMLQLNDLEEIREERSQTRAKLEKAIAMNKATKVRPRITVSTKTLKSIVTAIDFFRDQESSESTSITSIRASEPVPTCDLNISPHCCKGYFTVDAINYHEHLLFHQNHTVSAAQKEYHLKMESNEKERIDDHSTRAEMILDFTTENIFRAQSELAEKVTSPFMKTSMGLWDKITRRESDKEDQKDVSDSNLDVENDRVELSPTTSFSSPPDTAILSPFHHDASRTSGVRTSNKESRSFTSSHSEKSNGGVFDSTFDMDNFVNQHNHDQWRGKKRHDDHENENMEDSNLTPPPRLKTRRSSEESSARRKGSKGVKPSKNGSYDKEYDQGVGGNIKQVVGDVASGLGASITVFTRQGIKTVRVAGKGAIRSVLEATRTLEMLTLGAYYTTSSTAFVTFKTRSARSISCQMLLSHEHYRMHVERAPNTADIIWDNVSIPKAQIAARQNISGYSFNIMAIFWSGVVTFVVNFTDLDKLSSKYDWIADLNLKDFAFYDFINQYLAVVVLLLIITLLPFLFDFVARHYEGLKRETDVQQSIMTRFFYYQLVNVYVTVASGTIINSIQEIVDHPRSLLSILGAQLPQVSIFFANLLLVKTLVSVPIEMLRVWPLLQVYAVKYFRNKKKMTRRDLRDGAFADLPLDYGWVYPNLLFVMMITVTYSCISPCIMPISVVYFGFVYLMYKYQLLYVYVNHYQAGGDMWYAVFDRSMILLICGSLVLLSYLGISKTFQTGPFYLILPQPLLILYFWNYCNQKFIRPSAALSLECTKAIDAINLKLTNLNQETPLDSFCPDVYCQPALVEPFLKPEAYRNKSMGAVVPGDEESGHLPFRHVESVDMSGPAKKEISGMEGAHDEQSEVNQQLFHDSSPLGQVEVSSGNDLISEHRPRNITKSSSRRLLSVREVDESMMEDDIDLLLSLGTGEKDVDDTDSQFEKIKDRRSTYHSYGTTDRTFIDPKRTQSSHEDKRRESK